MIVTVFNEYHPDERSGKAEKVYPGGIHTVLKNLLGDDFTVRLATQDEPYNGLPDDILDSTDVLIWWSKSWNNEVLSTVTDKVVSRIQEGMGAIFLHSAKNSKPFMRLMGTSCSTPCVPQNENGECERLFTVAPAHPIAAGVPSGYLLQNEEPCVEYFDIPRPDDIVFLGAFGNGMCVRAGVTFTRGLGKIFYFQPGHETFPSFHDPVIGKILKNAVKWAAPAETVPSFNPARKPTGIKEKVIKLFKKG